MSLEQNNPLMPLPPEHQDLAWTVERIRDDPDGLRDAFQNLDTDLLHKPGPYFETTPRDPDQKIESHHFGAFADYRRNLTVLPQRITFKEPFIDGLMGQLSEYAQAFPHRENLSEQLFHQPMAWVGTEFVIEMPGLDPAARPEDMSSDQLIQARLIENDCQAAYIGAGLQPSHPKAFSHFASFQQHLALQDRPMRLLEFRDNELVHRYATYKRLHDDSHWMAEWDIDESLDEVSLVVRARRWERGAQHVLRETDSANLLSHSEVRDYKGTLAAIGHAVLLDSPEATREALTVLRGTSELARRVVKAAFGARKERVWVDAMGSRKQHNESSVGRIIRGLSSALENGEPIQLPGIMQPRYEPCSMANLGFSFGPQDREQLADYQFRGPYYDGLISGAEVHRTPPEVGAEAHYVAMGRLLCLVEVEPPFNYKPVGVVMRFVDARDRYAIHGRSDTFTAMGDVEGLQSVPMPSRWQRGFRDVRL